MTTGDDVRTGLGDRAEALGETRLWELIRAGHGLVAELDVDRVIERLLDVARAITGARYAAVGILDADRTELERFVTRGVEDEVRVAIGELPKGRGILGLLIADPRPLRLHELGDHPRSYGFPPGHPPMHTFLGVPILIRGAAFGNLYLTDKKAGDFDVADEQAAAILATWAAIAVENARLYRDAASRRDELDRLNRGLEATTTIARAAGAETDLAVLLDLIVKRARALVNARTVVIWLQDGDELAATVSAGEPPDHGTKARIPLEGTVSGEVARTGRGVWLEDAAAALRRSLDQLGLEASSALLAPLAFRGEVSGVIAAYDHTGAERRFSPGDEELLHAFAASAATAVATARSVAADRLRQSLEAAEQERRRWARELHDETLQGLAGLAVALRTARRTSGEDGLVDSLTETVDHAVEQLQEEIERLRALIAQLRPTALDELGLAAAVQGLADRMAGGYELVETDIHLAYEEGANPTRLVPDLEGSVYRLVQEGLTNIVKHADARRIAVAIAEENESITVLVKDDGAGFDATRKTSGVGLVGMRERVELAGGALEVSSAPGEGTTVRATLPAHHRAAA